MIEFSPVTPAFFKIFWRTAAPFIRGNDHGCRFARHRDEDVVDDDIGCIDILSTMDTTIHLFEALTRRELLFSAATILNG